MINIPESRAESYDEIKNRKAMTRAKVSIVCLQSSITLSQEYCSGILIYWAPSMKLFNENTCSS